MESNEMLEWILLCFAGCLLAWAIMSGVWEVGV